jgi:uncharacterized protein with NRDE domain
VFVVAALGSARMSSCSLPIATSATRARASRVVARRAGRARRPRPSAHGTWLAVDRSGRLAAVTNFRDGSAAAPLSRGALVADYLRGAQPLDEFAAALGARRNDYGPFSLLLRARRSADREHRAPPASSAPACMRSATRHSASNGRRCAARARHAACARDARSRRRAVRAARGRSGGNPEERYMTSHFVEGPIYGTRSSTVIAIGRDGQLTFAERSFDASARITSEVRTSFALGPLASRSTTEPV